MPLRKSMNSSLCGIALLAIVIVSGFGQDAVGKWKPLGSGSNNTIYALTVYNGQLIACGHSGGNPPASGFGIARWDGQNWNQLAPEPSHAYYCLAVYNGDLIVGGQFTVIDGVAANHIARWDGTSWHPLGNGMTGGGGSGGVPQVEALTVYNGELIAGGDFRMAGTQNANYIARWDGTSWNAIGAIGVGNGNDACRSLTSHNGELIAGGDFTFAGETTYILHWNGISWQPLGVAPEFNAQVFALTVHNRELIASGDFAIGGGQGFNGIARWNGSMWHGMGNGFGGFRSVTTYQGDLIAGGGFSFEDGYGQIFNRVAKWNGTSWKTMDTGMNLPVLSLTVYQNHIIAGGDFTFASNNPANRIARWVDCPGDATVNEVVNVDDLLIVIGLWGHPELANGIADINHDGAVNVDDLLAVINHWGPCP